MPSAPDTATGGALGFVLKGWPRISETFIAGEIEELEAQGLGIRILSMRQPREDFGHERFRNIRAGVDYLPTELLRGLARTVPAFLACLLRNPARTGAGLKLLARRLRHSRRPLATLKHFLQGCYIARLLPDTGIAHLHAHFAHSPTSVALFAAQLAGLRFSFTGHAKDIWTQDPAELARKIGAAAFVVTCTATNAAYLQSLNPGGTPLHCVRHGIDLEHFAFAPRAEAPAPPYRLLTVARLTAKKGLPTVLQAVAVLRSQGHDVRHTLVGAGEDEAGLKALAAELGIGPWVDFAGVQPHERVIEELSRAHVFVLASRITANGDRDGIPNVLAEAMACGVPVVATAVSAIPELVEDGVSGLLVAPEDPEALATAVLRALGDPKWRQASTQAARARVEAIFDRRTNTRQLATVFRDELGRKG